MNTKSTLDVLRKWIAEIGESEVLKRLDNTFKIMAKDRSFSGENMSRELISALYTDLLNGKNDKQNMTQEITIRRCPVFEKGKLKEQYEIRVDGDTVHSETCPAGFYELGNDPKIPLMCFMNWVLSCVSTKEEVKNGKR